MNRDSMFYRIYVLERLHLYGMSIISLAQLIWELEQCEPYLQLDDEDLYRYEDIRSVLEELYAVSLAGGATETLQAKELIAKQLLLLNAMLAQH